MAALLAELNPSLVHIHHLMYLPPSLVTAIIEWQGQKFFTIHDFYGVCPQYYLMNYQGSYCGVPEPDECDRCAKKLFGTGYTTIAAQRRMFQRLVDSVSLVIAPSHAALAVFRKAISVPEIKTMVIPTHWWRTLMIPLQTRCLLLLPKAPTSILSQVSSELNESSTSTENSSTSHETSVRALMQPADGK